jgi:hypothetical protein
VDRTRASDPKAAIGALLSRGTGDRAGLWGSRIRKDGDTFLIDSQRYDLVGLNVEHVAGIDDFEVAEATYQAAVARWPAGDAAIAASRVGS